MHDETDRSPDQCIQDCIDCYRSCLTTIEHGIEAGGGHAEPGHLRILRDCAAICAAAADFMLRRSDAHGRVCALCADLCKRCAEDCARFGDDPQMKSCADVCRRCAESCRRMAA